MILSLRLIFVFFVAMVGGCTTLERHTRSGLNSHFKTSSETSYRRYLNDTKKMISEGRYEIDPEQREKAIAANQPFEFLPAKTCSGTQSGVYKKGILLIHGLSDSPYSMRDMARVLQDECFYVSTILLPGHGTRPGDLLNIKLQDWKLAVDYGVAQLKQRVRNPWVGGFSTGGGLSIAQAAKDDSLKGVILIAPAIALHDISRLKVFIGDFFLSWFSKKKDLNYAAYESSAMQSIIQVIKLTKENQKKLRHQKIKAPVFTALSLQDTVVDQKKGLELLLRWANQKSRFLIYDRSGESKKDSRIYVKKSQDHEQGILDMSHLGIHIKPGNQHYGIEGDYKYCVHYQNDKQEFDTCHLDSKVHWGSLERENVDVHAVRRLTFNPWFDDFEKRLRQFVRDNS